MVWWTVDNYLYVLLVLAIVAACFATAWWRTRNNKLLIGVALPAALMLLAFVLSLFIVTDKMQLRRDVEAMRDLLNAGNLDEFIEYFDDELILDTAGGNVPLKKTDLQNLARSHMDRFKIKAVDIPVFEKVEVSRPKATAFFIVRPETRDERARCIMEFTFVNGKWRVKKVGVEMIVGGQKLLSPR